MAPNPAHPIEAPANKHQLFLPAPLPPSSDELLMVDSNSSYVLETVEELFQALDMNRENPELLQSRVCLANVYTYPDGPSGSHALGRAMQVVGYASVHLEAILKLEEASKEKRKTWCSLGVHRADHHYSKALPQDKRNNSDAFAKLLQYLHEAQAVAIVQFDNKGRVGTLSPFPRSMWADGMEIIKVGHRGSYVGQCRYRSVDQWKALLVVGPACSMSTNLKAAASNPRRKISGDGPSFRPDIHEDNDNDTPMFQPENDGDCPPLFNPDAGDNDGGMVVGESLWSPEDNQGGMDSNPAESLWSPDGSNLWTPGGDDNNDADEGGDGFDTSFVVNIDQGVNHGDSEGEGDPTVGNGVFHADSTAQQADKFYSNLKREMKSRAESRLYHMRAFNGWVKAMQIVELNPLTNPDQSESLTNTKKRKRNGQLLQPIRVLDLACGKGGDLLKWVSFHRGVSNYVGVDVARGSLRDAAERVQKLGLAKLPNCSFVCADLGHDVIGYSKRKHNLLTWRFTEQTLKQNPPRFDPVLGGGVMPKERFDVISIQFAIHYMMSTRQRARRFFRTVGDLLDVGGNMIATTIDARVVVQHIMDLGIDFFQFLKNFNEDGTLKEDLEDKDKEPITVQVGKGACRLKFDRSIVKRLFESHVYNDANTFIMPPMDPLDERNFGLTYTFTLVEGEDHAAGFGEAVDLPEWLSPIPMLNALAAEAGLEIESVENFHEFFRNRSDYKDHGDAHMAMYKMHVLNRFGSISEDEWEISRLYMAIKFTKVRDCKVQLEGSDNEDDDEEDDENEDEAGWGFAAAKKEKEAAAAPKDPMKVAMAMKKAKQKFGADLWNSMSSEQKTEALEEFYS